MDKKEMTLRDIQKVGLDILRCLHQFCGSNGINYSLGYGTLLGAIRHNGFIPWDDDVDIIMLRKDYEKFLDLWRDNEKYKLFSWTKRNMYGVCARLCEMQETNVKTLYPLFTEQTGIWIDIFPVDFIPDDPFECLKLKKKVCTAHRNTLRRRALMSRSLSKDMFSWVYLRIKCPRNTFYYVEQHDLLCKTLINQPTQRLACLSYPTYSDWDYIPKSLFDDIIEKPFEGEPFCVIRGYDEWLRIIFGDYMTLPPEEKRVNHSFHKYFWR